ncbi:MAG: lysylphosphatidylglycerol synthase transmembrane domain-containing protein [Candidatus Cloacimonas sp.]|jgi:uncharacterized protein (TIRG00374 family)|nr:lysylphosphatidylglycerol synthase transmembrane domain-containing protein [Candidatus Cloacimonas sp.]
MKKRTSATSKINPSRVVRNVLSIISLLFIAYFVIKNSANIHLDKPWILVICLIFPLFVNPFIANNRWKYFLAINGIHESILRLAKITFISTFYGLILPSSSGFDAIRIYKIEKFHPESRGKAGSTVVLERLMGILSLCIITMLSALFMRSQLVGKTLKITIFFIGLTGMVLILTAFMPIWYTLMSKIVYSKNAANAKYIKGIISYIDELHQALHLAFSIRMMIKSFALISLYQLSTIINVALVYKALGVNLPFTVHLLIMPVIYIFSIIPITISGFGVREGLFTFFYSKFGVESAVAITASLVNYAILTLVPALIGFIITLALPEPSQISRVGANEENTV